MNCNEAKHLIDLRVHAASEAADPARDWSALDAHLSSCPSCAGDYRELLRTRELLAGISNDQPTHKEIDSMMAALAAPNVNFPKFASRRSGSRLRLQILTGLATAAVLGLAFDLGSRRFGGGGVWNPLSSLSRARELSVRGNVFSNVESSLPTGSAESNAAVNEQEQARWNSAYNSSVSGDRPATTEKTKVSKRQPSPSDGITRRAGNQLADREKSQTELWSDARSGNVNVNGLIAPSSGEVNPAAAPPPAPSILFGAAHVHGSMDSAELLQEGPADARGTIRLANKDDESRTEQLERMTPPNMGRSVRKVELQQQLHRGDSGQGAFSGGGQSAPEQKPTPRPSSKIIKTGELNLEVPSYETAVTRLEKILAESAAVIADAFTQEQPGGALTGRIVIRCPPETFEALFAALKQIGRVESENAKAADVTAEYVDLEARIHGLQITEERLHDLVKNKSIVDKVSALLEVERELSRVRSQIEQLQGQLRVMADRVALSTISVTLREPGRTVPSASLSVEVPVLHEAVEALGRSLESFGGRLVSGDTTTQTNGTLMGTYQLQVSLRNFAALQTAIENLGRVEQRQVKDRDFSAQPAAVQPAADDLDRVKCSLALALFERSRQLPNAQLRVEVDNVDATMSSLIAALADANGAILSNRTTRQNDGSNVAELKLRVPAGKFAALLDAFAPFGRTTHKQVNGETGSILGGAASTPSELSLTLAERPREVPSGTVSIEVTQFTSARDALSKLVAEKNVQVLASASSQRPDGTWVGQFRLGIKSADMEAVVSTLERLGRVAGRQISGLGLGDLSHIAPDTIGAVALTLTEPSAINPSPDQAGGTLRGRLRAALEALYDSLGLIVYGLIVLAPWLVVVVLIAWLIARLRRNRTPVVVATTNS